MRTWTMYQADDGPILLGSQDQDAPIVVVLAGTGHPDGRSPEQQGLAATILTLLATEPGNDGNGNGQEHP